MTAMTLLQVLCACGAFFVGTRIATRIGADIRASIFDRVLGFRSSEIGHFGTSSLITRTTNDVQQVQAVLLTALTLMMTAPLSCVGAIIMALGQDVPLSFLLLAALPVLTVPISGLIRRINPLFRTMQQRIDAVNRVLHEQITGVRVIRAFVKDQYEQQRFARANDELMDVAIRSGRLTTLILPMTMTTVNVLSVLVMWIGAHRIDGGAMRIGSLTAFLTYLALILASAMTAASMLQLLPRAEVCAERVDHVLASESGAVAPTAPVQRVDEPGVLELRSVDFSYPGAEAVVLQGVDLVVAAGERIAITGSTGSGKSTLLGLVARLSDVTGGQVLIGDEDVRNLDPVLLTKTVGLVPQRPYLFSGTVASNLRLGQPDATDAELWHALEVAQAKGFVARLDGGLTAPIAQGGTNVSGGQRQRLAIARTLLRHPEIYLFDDAFSALDQSTEAALRAALMREIAGATVVMVAQRVTTIRDANRIVVLDEGRVSGTGTHAELMTGNSTYREIVLSQLTEEEAG